MKHLILSFAFTLIGSLTFASNDFNNSSYENFKIEVVKNKISSVSELNNILKSKNLSVSKTKYDENGNICGFTLSYDNGPGNSWSTWYDCSDMTMDDVLYFLLTVFF